MNNKKEIIKNIFRWIGILPITWLSYFLFKFISNICFSYIVDPDFVHELLVFNGFSGHYILGPSLLFIQEAVATGLAIFYGTKVAPKYKKIVYFILLSIFLIFWVLYFVIFGSEIKEILNNPELSKEGIIRGTVELIGKIVGIIICGFYLREKEREDFKEAFNKYETLRKIN